MTFENTLPTKLLEYFSFQWFFVFCWVCKVFIYLIYIHTNRYYFWGVNSYSMAKWTAKVQKSLFWSFILFDDGENYYYLIVILLPYLFVCLLEILSTISLFIYHLVWCDLQGINTMGTPHRRTPGVFLVYHKVMYTKALPITNISSFHIKWKKWSVCLPRFVLIDSLSVQP